MYEWLKVLHLLAVFAWMAGLFYLPRLFVYHADAGVGSETDATFIIMERRLLKAIMRPSAVVVLLSGGGLLHVLGYPLEQVWLWLKLLAVGGMFAFHGWLESFAVQFAHGGRPRSSRFFRIINEIPTVLLIVIVIAVVVRPFA
jgi:protoporphyrinogen IX oxidase